MSDYWTETIECAFADCGIKATKDQIECVAGAVEVSHENFGMAHGYDVIPNPLRSELDDAKRQLREWQAKEVCPECHGKKWLTTHGPIHSITSQCWKCRGEGMVKP